MALSTRTKYIVEIALADRRAAAELNAAVDAGSSDQAAAVADISPTTPLVGVDGTGSNAAPLVETEDRLAALEAKVDELLGALRAAGIIAP